MIQRLAIFVLFAASLPAAEFQNGQAARAVIGQPSFSSRDTGINAVALTVANSRLYAAEVGGHVLTFDLSRIPGRNDDPERQAASCAVCGFPAIATARQAVMPGVAGVSVSGDTVVMADPARHRVLIWKDVTSPRSNQRSDVILGRSSEGSVSASTLVDPVSVAFDGKRVFVGDAALHRVLVWNGLPTQDDQPADVVLGQPNFNSSGIGDSPGADTIRLPAALASNGTDLFVADPPDQRILVFSPGDFPLAPSAVVNSASLMPGPVAPGTLINIKLNRSAGISETQESGTGQRLQKKLGGMEVLLDGVALPLLSVKADAVEAQVPYDIAASSAPSIWIRIQREGAVATSNAVGLRIETATPGLYAFGGTEPRTGLLLHAGARKSDLPGSPVTGNSPAKPGEELTLWASGLGLVNDSGALSRAAVGVPFSGPPARVLSPLTASVDGQPVEVRSAILTPGAVGVYEIHILLPDDLASDPGAELVVSQNGYTSNTIQFPISAHPEK